MIRYRPQKEKKKKKKKERHYMIEVYNNVFCFFIFYEWNLYLTMLQLLGGKFMIKIGTFSVIIKLNHVARYA